MDWNLIGAVIIGIVLASIAEAKFINQPVLVPESAPPPASNSHVGYSSSDPVRNFMDNYS